MMNCVRRVLSVALVLAVATALLPSQSRLPNARLHDLLVTGIDQTWRQEYATADSVFDIVIREFPAHPAGYVYKAGVAQAFALDHELPLKSGTTDSLLTLGKAKAEFLCTSKEDSQWGYYFLGTANGYDSYARVAGTDWIGGIVKGLSSVKSFEKAITIDSALTDARAGIGAFYYWRSRKTEHFNWLPFVGDKRNEGIALLTKNASEGIYNQYTALSMLVAIYTDAKRYELAVDCAQRALRRYPDNRVFLWALATVWEEMDSLREATLTFEALLQSIRRDPAKSSYNEMICRLKLAEVLAKLGDGDAATDQLHLVLKNHPESFPSHLQERAQRNIERARVLLRNVNGKAVETR